MNILKDQDYAGSFANEVDPRIALANDGEEDAGETVELIEEEEVDEEAAAEKRRRRAYTDYTRRLGERVLPRLDPKSAVSVEQVSPVRK